MQPISDLVLGGFPPIWQRPLAFVDTESTGLPRREPAGDPNAQEAFGHLDVIDIAIIRDGLPWTSKVRLSAYDEERADRASRGQRTWREVTGYNRAEWASAPTAAEIAPEVARQLHGCVVVAHNWPYDEGLLSSWLERHGIAWRMVFTASAIDTYQLARSMCGNLAGWPRGKRGPIFSLEACCDFFGIEREQEHRALGGAKRCQLIYHHLTKLVAAGHAAPPRCV